MLIEDDSLKLSSLVGDVAWYDAFLKFFSPFDRD